MNPNESPSIPFDFIDFLYVHLKSVSIIYTIYVTLRYCLCYITDKCVC